MSPVEFERHEIAKSLFDEIKRLGGENYVAVRIRGETLWEVVRPKSPKTLLAALSAAGDDADRIERLRRILARYGDRVQMAMCHRPDWQQEIDEALEFVANLPSDSDGSPKGGDASSGGSVACDDSAGRSEAEASPK